MSYEGYKEFLCEDGHYFIQIAYPSNYQYECDCGKPVVWNNPVDETNNPGYEYGEKRLRVKTKPHYKICGECGNKELVHEVTYHIPTDEEMNQYNKDKEQYYQNWVGIE